nr:translation initiation factor IF-2-like [Aegilops tauschii subsp. strangulata]
MALRLQDPRGLADEVGRALGRVEGAASDDEMHGGGLEWQAVVVAGDGERRGAPPRDADSPGHIELPRRERQLGLAEADGAGGRPEEAVGELPPEHLDVELHRLTPLVAAPRLRRPCGRRGLGVGPPPDDRGDMELGSAPPPWLCPSAALVCASPRPPATAAPRPRSPAPAPPSWPRSGGPAAPAEPSLPLALTSVHAPRPPLPGLACFAQLTPSPPARHSSSRSASPRPGLGQRLRAG